MSLAGHELKHESRYGCLIIAKTGPRSPVQYDGDYNAARPPESGPDEVGSLSVSSLPLIFDTPSSTNASRPAKKPG